MPKDYSQNIKVVASIKDSFTAITENIGDWWGAIEGKIHKEGDEFTVKFDETFWKFRAVGFVSPTKIVWECVDGHHVHPGMSNIEREWIGTLIEWEITEKDGRTKIEMTHKGLTPTLDCYNVCKEGWDYYFLNSLKKYLGS